VVHEFAEQFRKFVDPTDPYKEDNVAYKRENQILLFKGLYVSCRLLGAMIEGRGASKHAHRVVGEQLSTAIFQRHVVAMSSCKNTLKELHRNSYVEDAKEVEVAIQHLETSSYDLFSVYEQVGASFKDMQLDIDPLEDEDTDDEGEATANYSEAYKELKKKVCRIEFMWHGRVDVLFFPKPDQAEALSEASKRDLEANVIMDTTESKQRDFLIRARRLVDEMNLLHESRKVYFIGPIFGFVEKNIVKIRLATFVLGVLVNLVLMTIVVGPGGNGYPYVKGRVTPFRSYSDDWAYASTPRRIFSGFFRRISFFPDDIVYVLLAAITVGYGIIASFNCFVKARLIFKEKMREVVPLKKKEKKEKKENDSQSESGSDENSRAEPPPLKRLLLRAKDAVVTAIADVRRLLPAFIPVLLTASGVAAGLFVFEVTDTTHRDDDEGSNGGYLNDTLESWRDSLRWSGAFVIAAILIPTIKDVVERKQRKEGRDVAYLTFYSILLEFEVSVPVIMCFLAQSGQKRFYYASILLVDIVFINSSLKNVMKAVTTNAFDIFMTLLLMFSVVFIFASFGIWQFGQFVQFPGDDDEILNANNGAAEDGILYNCPNLAVCFLHFLDMGLRTGDIVDVAFTDVTWNYPSMPAWIGRIIYAFSFFFVVGVILFNIVAGIIIDAFGGLREKAQERQALLRNESFIAGIERSTYEENGWHFADLNAEEQAKWDYVFFLEYLDEKNEDEYTGAESHIQRKLNEGNPAWLPDRQSWRLQLKHGAGSLDEEDMPQDIQKIKRKLKENAEQMRKLERTVTENFQTLEGKMMKYFEEERKKRPKSGVDRSNTMATPRS
jgi:hypothetical protein